ncbi:GNAT family N-acetyltransferase [Chlorogloea sp. CCALA 695]|uniref:GNAT family N-acetyltransferase n=1 Tax=Chlorogloea sp. CCALA 695 TaxID=2107693 RepID=UPI000D04B389|nr:GNAT family N-acetyltransferase [Chlorogloea sp. CCALA 695]PSB32243.1 GNAT family N-acetyltransferase [Chlorogloea sp. CCALA 695]
MIRLITPDDTGELVNLAESIGLFSPYELEELHQMLTDSLSKEGGTHPFSITDDDDGLVGLAYCEPERMTSGTWNLQLIVVHPTHQQQGRGGKLLHFVEETLTERGARVLLVETMGTSDFEYVRAFYRKNGYDEEARIREFYAEGADKIVFRKALSNQR